MKNIYLILTIVISTISCGDNRSTKSAVTDSIQQNLISGHEDFCNRLTRELKFQFSVLDSLSNAKDYSDSTSVYQEMANDRIYSLLSELTKDNKFRSCNPSDSTEISYAISADKNLVLSSWDTRFGGTMVDFVTAAIYQNDNGIFTKLLKDTTENRESSLIYFTEIHEVIDNTGQPIYLAYGVGQAQALMPWLTIKAFRITKDLEEMKIFPNDKSQIELVYDFTTEYDNNLPDTVVQVQFVNDGQKIILPVLSKFGKATGKYKTLTFDGRKFKSN